MNIIMHITFGSLHRQIRFAFLLGALHCLPVLADTPSNPSTPSGLGWTIFLVAWLMSVVCGVIGGWRRSLTVFRNYDDLALVFFAGFTVVVTLFLVWVFGQGSRWFILAVLVVGAVVFLGLFSMIVLRTWTDNPSIVAFPIALVTKLSLAALFLLNLVSLINPSGKSQLQRAQNRASALGWLAILTPIVYRMVRDKEGVWAPRDVFNQYQRGKLGL